MKTNFLSQLKRYLPDGFITALLLMIVLAYFIPGIGKEGSWFNLSKVSDYGIALLFFFYGLRLSPEKMISDLKDWRLHVIIQSITFIVFPLLLLLFYPIFRGTNNELLWLAVFFLAALPSTVTSSVVMVSIAEGNIPAAIFNASISGIIGIVVTPVWMGLFLTKQQEAFAFGPVIRDLVIQILLPVVAGLFMHKFWGKWALKYKRYLGLFDKAVVLSIVYQSFSNSFLNGVFNSIPKYKLVLLSASVILLFFTVYEGTKLFTKWMKFNREDRITIIFSSSKKSLIHGSVMASVLFAGASEGSLFLVPVMIYHAFQLFYVSLVARRMAMEHAQKSEVNH
jgi:sodium/bile acid cotransporter 7